MSAPRSAATAPILAGARGRRGDRQEGDRLHRVGRLARRRQAARRDRVKNFGGIDIVVNNAAILRDAFVFRADPRDWDAVIRNNLSAPFYLINAATAVMRDQGKSGRGGATLRLGPHRQHRLVGRPLRQSRPGGLCQRQGRPVRPDPRRGDGPAARGRSPSTPWRRSRAPASPTSSSRPTKRRRPTRSARSRSARTMSPIW